MLLELHCNILWVVELPHVKVWCNQLWFYSLLLFGYLSMLSFNCLWFDLCLMMTWSLIYLTGLNFELENQSQTMFQSNHHTCTGCPMAYQSGCWRRESCTLKQGLILPGVEEEESHWGLESLGSSVARMNPDLHRKSTPKILNDLHSK